MNNRKLIEWVLRVAVAGEFIGHGTLALLRNLQWIGWMQQLFGMDATLAGQVVFAIGCFDWLVALLVLVRPIRIALLWAAFWGLATAVVRPIVGQAIWDCIERSANWGAPLALLLILGWPRTSKDWFRSK